MMPETKQYEYYLKPTWSDNWDNVSYDVYVRVRTECGHTEPMNPNEVGFVGKSISGKIVVIEPEPLDFNNALIGQKNLPLYWPKFWRERIRTNSYRDMRMCLNDLLDAADLCEALIDKMERLQTEIATETKTETETETETETKKEG